MTSTSIGWFAVPSLALVAALVFGIPHLRRQQPIEPRAASAAVAPLAASVAASPTAVHAVGPPASSVEDKGSVAPTMAPPALAAHPRTPGSGEGIKPSFDVAVIGPAGDCVVIAGTAAPGATVELFGESANSTIEPIVD